MPGKSETKQQGTYSFKFQGTRKFSISKERKETIRDTLARKKGNKGTG